MIKSFDKFNETFDWSSTSSLTDGKEYKNVVNGHTQLIIVPPIERIDVGTGVVRVDEDKLLMAVERLCKSKGHLAPGRYLQDDVYLHFANADSLSKGVTDGEWDGGFLVLWAVTRNTRYKVGITAFDEYGKEERVVSNPGVSQTRLKPELRNLKQYPNL